MEGREKGKGMKVVKRRKKGGASNRRSRKGRAKRPRGEKALEKEQEEGGRG